MIVFYVDLIKFHDDAQIIFLYNEKKMDQLYCAMVQEFATTNVTPTNNEEFDLIKSCFKDWIKDNFSLLLQEFKGSARFFQRYRIAAGVEGSTSCFRKDELELLTDSRDFRSLPHYKYSTTPLLPYSGLVEQKNSSEQHLTRMSSPPLGFAVSKLQLRGTQRNSIVNMILG